MKNQSLPEIQDELVYSICDLKKLLFLSECNNSYRRDLIPNLWYISRSYPDDLLDELQADLIDLMLQQADSIELYTNSLISYIKIKNRASSKNE